MSISEPVRDGDRTELAPNPGPPAPAQPAPMLPGWHPDPSNPQGAVRWWDGHQWTGYVQAAVLAPVPAVPAPLPPMPGTADDTGVYRLTISKVTSMLVLTTRRSTTYTGTYDQLRKAYRNVLTYNLLLGWWGFPFGLIWTPMSLARNAGAMRKLKRLAGQP